MGINLGIILPLEVIHSLSTAYPQSYPQSYPQAKEAGVMVGKFGVICKEVLDGTGYTLRDLKGLSRTKSIVALRHRAMYRCYKETGASLREISLYFGRKDHSSVVWAIKYSKFASRMAQD